jgi:hypothetical protein
VLERYVILVFFGMAAPTKRSLLGVVGRDLSGDSSPPVKPVDTDAAK